MTPSDDAPNKRNEPLPEPTGGAFYAPPPKDLQEHRATRRVREEEGGESAKGAKPYRLRHRSEVLYPQVYEPVSGVFWQGLSKGQVDAVMRLQAIAMEKAGFEKHTPKYFIEDFDPGAPGAALGSTAAARQAQDPVSLAAPRLLLGGALLGMGALALVLALTTMLEPTGPVAAAATLVLVVGLLLGLNARA
jgi:hypothetical protein